MSSSADTTPISPARFAAALKDLSAEMLQLKVVEIRNSIAHLEYSNSQLKPFAEGTETATSGGQGPDQDCIDAIHENENVIERMLERIAFIYLELEARGVSWAEFGSDNEVESRPKAAEEQQENSTNGINGLVGESTRPEDTVHSAWNDGTFQTGTIHNGEVHLDGQAGRPEGGSVSDEELQRRLEERVRQLETEDGEGGMHL